MERFRLRVRHQPKRGNIWELHLEPDRPGRDIKVLPLRMLGSASTPQAIHWLAEVAAPLLREVDPQLDAARLGPKSEAVYLDHMAGMRLALAFSAARYLSSPAQRRLFREGLQDLPNEVVLYWFTLCFYGRRTAAGRAALRTLLAYDESENPQPHQGGPAKKRPQAPVQIRRDLFSLVAEDETSEANGPLDAALFGGGRV